MKKAVLKYVKPKDITDFLAQSRIERRIQRYNASIAHFEKKHQDHKDSTREYDIARDNARGHGGVDTADSQYYLRRRNSSFYQSEHASKRAEKIRQAKKDYKAVVRRLYGERYTIPE